MLSENNTSGTQLEISVTQESEALGYVVIDSSVAGRSRGGLRLAPNVSLPELRDLARSMTLKFGFLGLPQGGGKAGLLGDPEAPPQERLERLKAFGQALAPLLRQGIFLPHTDMGTCAADIRLLLESSGAKIRKREWDCDLSGPYTALTVFCGTARSASQVGLSLPGCRVAIEGFGKVGSALALQFAEVGALVVAVSTARGALYNPRGLDVARLGQLSQSAGSECVDLYREADRIAGPELLELNVDLLCPCAGWRSIHAGNAGRIPARVVCCGANSALSPEAERELFGRGVLCLPDFVTNCGGVLGGTLAYASVAADRIASFIDRHIGERIAWLLQESARRKMPPRDIIAPLALQRHRELAQRASRPSFFARCFQAGSEMYGRGWAPGWLAAAFAEPLLRRRMGGYTVEVRQTPTSSRAGTS